MPDEKKDHDLDADILQSKADILKALRAAGKPTSNKPDTTPEQTAEILSEEDSLDEADIIDLPDDESELDVLEESTPDELISEFPEDEPIRIVSFEESKQYNGSTDSPSSDIIESPAAPEASVSLEEPDSDIEQLQRNNRRGRHPLL